MTTDTKVVARFDRRGRFGFMDEALHGEYMRFTDHERVVGELREHIRLSAIAALELDAQNRKDLAASRAEAKGLSQSLTDSLECEEDYLREISELRAEVEGLKKLLGETAQCLADVSNDVGGWAVEEIIESAMNAAMENGNV